MGRGASLPGEHKPVLVFCHPRADFSQDLVQCPLLVRDGRYLLPSRVHHHLMVHLMVPFLCLQPSQHSPFMGSSIVWCVRRQRLAPGLSRCISAGFVGDQFSLFGRMPLPCQVCSAVSIVQKKNVLPVWRREINLPKRGDDGESPLLGTREKLVLLWSKGSMQLLGQNQPPLALGWKKKDARAMKWNYW